MKKHKKLLFLGTIGAVAMPIAAFSFISQSFEDITEDDDEEEEVKGTDISQNGGINGIGVDPNSGDDHSSVQAQITEQNGKLTITLTGNGTIDKNLFNKLLKQRFYKTNSDGAVEADSNQETRYFPVEKIILTDDIKLPDDSSNLFNFYTSYDEGTEELEDSDDLSEYENQPKPKVVIENININTSNVTNMSNMFKNTDLNGIDFSKYPNWDVSNVTNLSGMFSSTTHANLDLTHWNINSQILEGDEEQEKNVSDMFKNTNGSVTINGEVAKKLFSKVPQELLDILMTMDSEDGAVYGVFDSSGKLLGYHSENGEPDEELINMLENGIDYTFKLAEVNSSKQIDNYNFLNSKQKEALKQSIADKQSADEPKDYNEVIKDAYNLDNKMEELTDENESKLKTYIQDKEKYTDEFNNEVEQLSKKVKEALENLNTSIENEDGINDLINQIENLKPSENLKPENSGTSVSDSATDSSHANPETTPTDSETHNDGSESGSQPVTPIITEAEDTTKEIKNQLAEYKNASSNSIDLLENLNKAQKDALKNEIKSKIDTKEISKIIDEANNLNSTMKQLSKVNNDTLSEFVEDKDVLSKNVKNAVENLNNKIENVLNVENDDAEVNKNQKDIQDLINQVNSLASNYKQNAQNNVDSLNYLNKAQKDDLKNKITRHLKPSEINKIINNSVNLDSKMQKLNDANENTLSEFANDSKNLPEDLKNKVNVLNNKVRSLITKNNGSAEANKNQEYVQQLIDEIDSLINQYKEALNSNLNLPKYKYLNDSQKEELKNQLNNVNTKKELDAIVTKTTRLNDKMKQLSVATVTDLQEIVDTKRFKKLALEAEDLKNNIIVHLPTNESSQGKNISEQEIDGYFKDIENLKARYLTPGIGNIKDITKGKKYYSGLITVNIIATVVALIITAVIIKKYKNRKY